MSKPEMPGPHWDGSYERPSVPRVAESLDDLAVGMVVAWVHADPTLTPWAGRIIDIEPERFAVRRGIRETSTFDLPWDFDDPTLFILADPPAPPAADWLVPADTMEALREAVRVFEDPESVGNRWVQYVDAVDAVLDAATEVER